MPASRNPFYLRMAEQSESDDQFLNLFSQAVLDLLPEDGSWNRFLPIEGAPGSGKSTLLRLFTPTVLRSIENMRGQAEYAGLIRKLTEINALDANGVQLLGVLVNCKDDYSRIMDFTLEGPAHLALFRALLHSRLALLTIRAALQLVGRMYPADVDIVRFEPRDDAVLGRPDVNVVTGRELFDRARVTEQRIVDSLNSFEPRPPSSPEDLNFVDVFQLLNTHRLLIDQQEATKHTLIMFDDAHMLDTSQREFLKDELERHDRIALAGWMAMRLRALDPPRLVSEAVSKNREHFSPVRFEQLEHSDIEKWLIDIGNRRVRRAQRDFSSFAACLPNSLETELGRERLASVATAERSRAYDLARPHGHLYEDWLAATAAEAEQEGSFDQAVRWSQLQILMERRIRKTQGEFNFGALAPVEVSKAGSNTIEPATMFIASRNNLPYFYGTKRITQLASTNVDQFLSLSAALFDRLLNSRNRGQRVKRELAPSEQHRLIVEQSRAYVTDIRTSLPYGGDVYSLIAAIAKLCNEESVRPNVPIAPGVTGISLQLSDRDVLIGEAQHLGSSASRLLNALGSAIAHNVLLPRITSRQSDEDRVVLYLNRLVCPAYNLPLGFGGYKPQRLSRLLEWVGGEPSPQPRLETEQPL